MSESENPNKSKQNLPSSSSSKFSNGEGKIPYPNPPDPRNPDPATLREQWRFAIKQYSKWYSHAWGTAILAGLSFFALGWIVKGSNPLPSFSTRDDDESSSDKATR